MSRIPYPSNIQKGEMASFFAQAEKWMGFLPNDGLLMAYKPAMVKAFFELAKTVYAEGKIGNDLKRMIGHLASRASGCQYCSAHTALGADKMGVEAEKLEAIWEFETSTLFNEAEKSALRVALKGAMSPNQVTDEDFENLRIYYDAEAIVEIVAVISMFGFLNRWNSTFNTELEDAPKNYYNTINTGTDG